MINSYIKLKMTNKKLIYFIFFLSGVSGLVYELLWSHYLKTFLGHSAYAQSLVLCIFMGGMAIGSYIAGRYSKKIKRPLFLYGVIEGIIGLFALCFHFIFVGSISLSYDYFFSLINNSLLVIIYKIILSSIIILPQTILLGMTFPLITDHFIKSEPENTSKNISFLYFANSIGAAFGIFITGFYLVENIGMPYTISIAGIINLLIFIVLVINYKKSSLIATSEVNKFVKEDIDKRLIYLLFVTAFGTGFSSFVYEIVWIRMLSLVLGSSTHNFEIMLCAFITGIAFGGLFIRLKADMIKNHLSFLAYVQILMGIAAILTLPLYNLSFELISYLINNLPKTEFGYYLFNLSSHLISFVIMLPATFLAGMTFPLLGYIIFNEGYAEKAVGYTYSINTVGAIIGVIFSIHIGFPFLGLKNLLFIGAGIDICLGFMIFYLLQKSEDVVLSPKVITTSSVSFIIITFLFFNFDNYKLASGVYREGVIFNSTDYNLSYYKDGKTASISVVGDGQYVSIRTNGKSDSAIAINENNIPSADEYTASLAALIPYFYKPDAKSVAVIGLGTGLTSHVALLNKNPVEVDTIEIEEKVVDGSKIFIDRNYLIFKDRRSKIYIDDAKTFFSIHRHKYDIIISEPSNPWISGVSALFSKEFYKLANKYLKTDGILIQWLQLYEIDVPHIASIIKAISNNFVDYALYVTTENELLIVASNEKLGCLQDDILGYPEYKFLLSRLHIKSLNDIILRKLGDKRHFDMFFKSFDVPENSDYHPIIERRGPELRFYGKGAGDLLNLTLGPLPILDLLVENNDNFDGEKIQLPPYFQRPHLVKLANNIKDAILFGQSKDKLPENVQFNVNRLLHFLDNSEQIYSHYDRLTIMFNIFSILVPNLPAKDIEKIINKIENSKIYKNLSYIETLWLKLFSSIKNKNYVVMALLSKELLEKDKGLPPVAEEYLLATYIIGNVVLESNIKERLEYTPHISDLKERSIVFQYLDSFCQ